MCVCAPCVHGALGGHERVWDPLQVLESHHVESGLELKAVWRSTLTTEPSLQMRFCVLCFVLRQSHVTQASLLQLTI